MKKCSSLILLVLLLAAVAITCKKDVPVTGITLDKNSLTLPVWQSEMLFPTVFPEQATNKSVTFTSNDPEIATVATNGRVVALSVGVAIITATTVDGNFSETCKVNVTSNQIPVTGVTLNKTMLVLDVNQTEKLIANVQPQYASNQNVTFTSANPSVATVTSDGLVSALSKGVTIITVTTVEGTFSATCSVYSGEIPVANVSLNKKMLNLSINETETLTATILPENATNKAVSWLSSNTDVATVTNGFVAPTGYGTAVISVSTLDGNKVANCNLKVYPTSDINEPEMVFVEGGTFTMGCTDNPEDSTMHYDCRANENPAHQVILSSFQISKFPVTQKLWNTVMGENPSFFKGDNRPVESVSWEDIQVFISKLNIATGKQYRLPTEAEWEFAARGGNNSDGYKYSGSDNLNSVAWYFNNSYYNTWQVGTKQPNELGIFDMSGNVCEWCSDWFGDYSGEAQADPHGPDTGTQRILRGGGWYSTALFCRISSRDRGLPDERSSYNGFRLVLAP